MHQIQKVSAAEAQKLISKALEEAEKISKHIAIAVVGPDGDLIAFLRMDGANAASATISQNKAYTAARDRCSTKSLGEKARKNQYPLGNWGDLRITGFGGGLPILQNGGVIGGIGVSGLSEDEDERIGNAAIESVYEK